MGVLTVVCTSTVFTLTIFCVPGPLPVACGCGGLCLAKTQPVSRHLSVSVDKSFSCKAGEKGGNKAGIWDPKGDDIP